MFHVLLLLYRRQLWKHYNKKFLLILDSSPFPHSTIAKILEIFRDYHNFVVMSQIQGTVGQKLLTLESLQNQTINYNKDVLTLDHLFNEKSIEKLNLFISIARNPPLSFVPEDQVINATWSEPVQFANLLCQQINGTCTFTADVHSNLILNNFLDACSISKECSPNKSHNSLTFELSYPLGIQEYCILLPKGVVLTSFWSIIHSFESMLFVYIPIFFFLSGIYWYYIVKGTPSEKKLQDIFLLLFGILITSGTHTKLNYRTEKILCFSFIVLSYYLLFGYTCKMTSFLVVPEFEKIMTTIKETDVMGMQIIIPFELERSLSFHADKDLDRSTLVLPNLINTFSYTHEFDAKPDRFGLFITTTEDKNFGQAFSCEVANMFVKSTANYKKDLPQFYILKEKLLLLHKYSIVRDQIPVMEHVNLLNGRLAENGILNFWKSGRPFEAVGNKTIEEKKLDNETFFKTGTVHKFWKILISGYLCALFIFCIEWVVFKLKK